nr:MAG: ATP-dependent DNA helicase RecG [Candidatus Kentron sp. FW]
MSAILPISVRRLLYLESARVEFKASWDEKTTGLQVLHTLCAFANDFQNLGGGYIVIGVAASQGQAILPPAGLDPNTIEDVQRWVRGKCNTLDPVCQPVISPERIEGKHVLVIWAPGSETRVHWAPRTFEKGAERRAYIQIGAETVEAKGELQTRLLQLTAKVPFDDRRTQ